MINRYYRFEYDYKYSIAPLSVRAGMYDTPLHSIVLIHIIDNITKINNLGILTTNITVTVLPSQSISFKLKTLFIRDIITTL